MNATNAGPAANRLLVCAAVLATTLTVGGCQYLGINKPTDEQLKASDPDLELIKGHLDDFVAASPNLKAGGQPKTCGELKIAMVQQAKGGAVVDMTAGNASAIKLGDTVYFNGLASRAAPKFEANGEHYVGGGLTMGAAVYTIGLLNSKDAAFPMNARIVKGEFARGGKSSDLFTSTGINVCGYGVMKNGPQNVQFVAVTDVLELGAPSATASIGGLSGESVTGLQAPGKSEESVPPPSGCELLEGQQQALDAACKSGRLQACREISGVVAAKVMEGCTTPEGSDASTAALPEEAAAPAPAPVVSRSPQQEKCDLINAQEDDIRASCKAGRIQSCREIQQIIGVRIMEGCKSREQLAAATIPPPVEVAKPKLPDREAKLTNMKANPPKYPPTEARQGVGGHVELIITIAPGSYVTDVQVGQSSGNRNLDRSAVETARKWTAQSAVKDGEEVTTQLRVPVDFYPPTDGDGNAVAPAPLQSGY